MDVFVVVDTKGSGRLVGVFDSAAQAQSLVQINPPYFKMRACTLNAVNPEVVRWALDEREQRRLEAQLPAAE